jgi:hypothetical protein
MPLRPELATDGLRHPRSPARKATESIHRFVSALLLGACSSVGQKVASGINNSHLNGTVGKPYNEVMYEHPDFGKLIGRGEAQGTATR